MSKKSPHRPSAPSAPAAPGKPESPEPPAAAQATGPASEPAHADAAAPGPAAEPAVEPASAERTADLLIVTPRSETAPVAVLPVEPPAAEPAPEPKFKAFLSVVAVNPQGFRRFGYHFTKAKTTLDPETLSKEQLLELRHLHQLKVLVVEVSYQPLP